MKALLKLSSEVRWIFFGQIVMVLASFFGLKILSNQLGAFRYGEVGLGLAAGSLVNSFIYGPLSNSFLRYLSDYNNKKKLTLFLKQSLKLNIEATLVFVPIAVVLIVLVGFVRETNRFILAFGFFQGVTSGFQSGLFSELMALRERKAAALNQAALFWLRQTLAFLFCWVFTKSAMLALFAYAVSDVIIFWVQYGFLKKKYYRTDEDSSAHPAQKRDLSKDLIAYALPFCIWAALNFLSTSGDRWIVEWIFNTEKVGLYYAISQISNAPTLMVGAVISQLVAPIAYDRASKENTKNIRKRSAEKIVFLAAFATGLVCLLGTMSSWPISHFIVRIFSNSEAASQSELLPVLILSSGIFQTASILMVLGQIYKNNWPYLGSLSIKVGSLFFLAMIWKQRFGLLGIGYAHVLSSFIFFISVIIANHMIVRCKNG